MSQSVQPFRSAQATESALPIKRRSLTSTSLKSVPFQLIARRTQSGETLERELVEQSTSCAELADRLTFDVVIWLDSVAPDQLAADLTLLFESLAVQSFSHFRVTVLSAHSDLDAGKARQSAAKFPFVIQFVDSSTDDFPVRAALNELTMELFDTRRYSVHLSSSTILHPQALYILARQILMKSSDMVFCNTLRLDRTLTSATTYERRAPLQRYSLLSHNAVGELLVLSGKALITLIDRLDDLQRAAVFSPWTFAVLLGANELRRSFVPLALAVSHDDEGGPVRNLTELVDDASAALGYFASLLQLPVGSFEPFVRSSKLYLSPAPSPASGEIRAVVFAHPRIEETIRTLRSLLAQDALSEIHLTIVETESSRTGREKLNVFLETTGFRSVRFDSSNSADAFSTILRIARECEEPFILTLKGGVEIVTPTAVSRLRGWCAAADVGAVTGGVQIDGTSDVVSGLSFTQSGPQFTRTAQQLSFMFREVNGVSLHFSLFKCEGIRRAQFVDGAPLSVHAAECVLSLLLRKLGLRTISDPAARSRSDLDIFRTRALADFELLELTQHGIALPEHYAQLVAEAQPTSVDITTTGDRTSQSGPSRQRKVSFPGWLSRASSESGFLNN